MIGTRFGPAQQAILLYIFGTIFILKAPYTKVEESFALQATHDYLFIASPTGLFSAFLNSTSHSDSQQSWDHHDFPGVVQRTFINSFVISLVVKPFQFFNLINYKFSYQLLSRLSLLFCFCLAYYKFIKVVAITHGASTSQLVTLLTVGQFHIVFYSSRTLPNTFALIAVIFAYACWLRKRWNLFIGIIAFTVLIIRFETILLFGWILLFEVFFIKELSLLRVLQVGIPSGLLSLVITILFDSFMWGTWTWPEGDGIWFNLVQNKSHLWGTHPFLWYFYSALPRVFLGSTVFLVLPLTTRLLWTKHYASVIAFILTYSILPHKELRFIIYAIPLLNLTISQTILYYSRWFERISTSIDEDSTHSPKSAQRGQHLHHKNKSSSSVMSLIKPRLHGLFKIGIAIHFGLNIVASLLMLYVSSQNYPGGQALFAVNHDIELSGDQNSSSVYVSNLAAQTGFTRFMELDHVYYNKEPRFELKHFQSYDVIYLVLEHNQYRENLVECNLQLECTLPTSSRHQCELLTTIDAFDRLDSRHFSVHLKQALEIFKCKKFV